MKCWKCGKEMDRCDDYEAGYNFKGIEIRVTIEPEVRTPEQVAYNNLQLGKYSNGNGECHIGICYECYLDGVFHLGI